MHFAVAYSKIIVLMMTLPDSDTIQIIKDWMLMIIVAVIVGLELVIMMVGTAIPESRITATPVLINELRQNVSLTLWLASYMYIIVQCHSFRSVYIIIMAIYNVIILKASSITQ